MRVTLIIQDDELVGLRDIVYSSVSEDSDVPVYPEHSPNFLLDVQDHLLNQMEEEDSHVGQVLKRVLNAFDIISEEVDEIEFIGSQGMLRITTEL